MAKNWMMDHERQALRVKADDLSRFVVEALTSIGLSPEDAQTTADVLVTTDTWGVSSHGVKSLRGYVRRLRAGGLKVHGRPKVVAEGPAWAQIDGDNSIGMVTSVFAMRRAMDKARAAGIGLATVRVKLPLRRRRLLSVARRAARVSSPWPWPTTFPASAPPAHAAPSPAAIRSPMPCRPRAIRSCWTWPAARSPAAKVMAAHYHNKQIPLDWIKDSAGNPSTDPAAFFAGGSLQPMAGHKGYGIALLIEMLAGCLSGAGLTWQIKGWIDSDPTLATGHGAAFVAIDVGSIMPLDAFKSRVDHVVQGIHDSPKAPGAEQIFRARRNRMGPAQSRPGRRHRLAPRSRRALERPGRRFGNRSAGQTAAQHCRRLKARRSTRESSDIREIGKACGLAAVSSPGRLSSNFLPLTGNL